MKKIIITISLILLGLFLIIPRDKTLIERIVIIPKGTSLKGIAQRLKGEGIIKNKFLFIVLAKICRASNTLKAGEYELNNRMGMIEILEKLRKGKARVYITTIPPGFTLSDIAGLLEKRGLANKYKFLNLAFSPSFIKRLLPINPPSLEGYLFPDTYFLHKGMDEGEIIGLMVERFNEVVRKELGINDQTLHQVITLASIIEKEAKAKEEYPVISAVFHNRLKKNIPLESCASVLYALGEKKERLSIEDTKIPSPYNTYRKVGLPPGAICNPGILAIKSALNPSNVDYLYFVSMGNGRHIFSKTASSHIFSKNLIWNK